MQTGETAVGMEGEAAVLEGCSTLCQGATQHQPPPRKPGRSGADSPRPSLGGVVGSDTHRGTHHVAKAEVKAALFVHGVVQPRELGQRWPVVGEGVIPQAVIGAGRGHMGATGCLQQDWPSSPGGS